MSSTTHAHTPQQSTPTLRSDSPLTAIAPAMLARHTNQEQPHQFFSNAYALGCFEGETAFALAATAALPGDVVARCKHMALVKLGLNDPACIATESLRGWLCAVFEGLGDAVDQLTPTQAVDNHHSALIAASRDLAQHFSTGELGIGPDSSIEACRAVDVFVSLVESEAAHG